MPWPASWPAWTVHRPFCCQGRLSGGTGTRADGKWTNPPRPARVSWPAWARTGRGAPAPAGCVCGAGGDREGGAPAAPARQAGVRVITLRSGIVMARKGGVLGRLLPLFRLGLGARLGPGTQVMSWVAAADWTRIARFLLDNQEVSGPVNLTSPNPVTNAAFTSALAAVLHRPAVLSVPSPVLTLALGGVTSDLLSSARVLPRRLSDAGFEFSFPDLAGALAAELG